MGVRSGGEATGEAGVTGLRKPLRFLSGLVFSLEMEAGLSGAWSVVKDEGGRKEGGRGEGRDVVVVEVGAGGGG